MPYNLQDAKFNTTTALPNGAATVSSAALDLGLSSRSDFVAQCELVVAGPTLAVGVLANAATMTYAVQTSPDNFTWTTLYSNVLTQTGAGGVGAAAASVRVRLPTNVPRYVRTQATNSGAGNASAQSYTANLQF